MISRLLLCFIICLAAAGSAWADNLTLPQSTQLILPPVSGGIMAINQNKPATIDMSQKSDKSAQSSISLKKAMLLSILLPGAGEYYSGAKVRGQIFMGIEAAVWLGFAAYRVYGGWKENDYKSYAAAHAGVDNSGKGSDFYDWIGFYDNRNEFNQLGRLYYPERSYMPDTRAYSWQWDSPANRLQYKNIKDMSKAAFRNSTFMIGLAIANRVISSIDTYRTVKAAQNRLASLSNIEGYHVSFSPRPFGANPGFSVAVSRKF
jgi:hypothetical protein